MLHRPWLLSLFCVVFLSSLAYALTVDVDSCNTNGKDGLVHNAIDESVLLAANAWNVMSDPKAHPHSVKLFKALFGDLGRRQKRWVHVRDVFRRIMAVKTNAPWMTIYCDETHLLFRKAKQNTVAHFKNVITGELYELLPGHNISPSGEAYSYCVNGLRNGMHYLAYAFMHRDVVFCEPAWTSPRWQKPLPTILEEDVQTPTLAHTRLDQYDSLGTILLHELTHTKLLGDDLTKDHDVLVRGQKRDCYDWQSCAALAKCCRQKPLTSAESYVIFAKALFLAPYDWSTGWANGKPPNGKKKSKPKRPLENPPLPDDDDVRPEKRPHRDEGTPDSEFASSETVEDLGWVWTAT